MIALPDADADGAVQVMDRIRAQLARALSGGDVQFTVSFGVTDSTCSDSLQDLIRIADAGLYRSKLAGRDRVSVVESDEFPQAIAGGGGGGSRRRTPALHQVVDEDDPR